jgi:peptidoglycan/xylan/chitin deacetylase (PgdA/CDA1 family)
MERARLGDALERGVIMLRRLIAGAVTLIACGGFAAAAHGATPLYVSLTFDDGVQGDFTQALPTLQKYGYQGTFYINSDKIATNAADRQTNYMLWSEVQQLQAAGMQIGGHTIGHTNLVTLWNTTYKTTYDATYDASADNVDDVNEDGTVDDADRVAAATAAAKTAATTAVGGNVCADRNALTAHGFSPTSFAYPNGAWKLDDGSQYGDRITIPAIIAGCGYSSARTTEGIAVALPEPVYCDVCYAPISDTTARRFSLRASQARGSQIAAEDGGGLPAQPGNDDLIPFSTLQGRTQLALDALHNPKPTDLPNPPSADGGWLILVLHDVCADDSTYPCTPDQSDADRGHSTTRAVLDAYLNWLKTRPSSDCVIVADVQTVMSPSRPTTCPVAPVKPTVSITGPANGSIVNGVTNLTADANDADGSVSKVEFEVNGVPAGSDDTDPYSVPWDPSSLSPGATATIVARAYDNTGQTTDSSPITVTKQVVTGGTGGGGGGGGGGAVTKPVVTPPAAPVETPPVAPVTDAPSQSAPQPAAPTVRLLKASSRLLRKGVVGFRAVVKAPAGVEHVEFLVNGKVVGTLTEGPFKFSWSPKAGKSKRKLRNVEVSVRVTDSLGRVAESGDPMALKVRLVTHRKRHR